MPEFWENAALTGWDTNPVARAMRWGQAAYDAYSAAVGGRSAIDGQPLPAFSNQRADIQDAWVAAALAVRNAP